jgi:hypothetical protein
MGMQGVNFIELPPNETVENIINQNSEEADKGSGRGSLWWRTNLRRMA